MCTAVMEAAMPLNKECIKWQLTHRLFSRGYRIRFWIRLKFPCKSSIDNQINEAVGMGGSRLNYR